MAIHIGKIIKLLVKKRGMSVTAFADKINYSRRNVYEIFEKGTIDTGLLIKIGKVLEENLFFNFISEEEMYSHKNSKLKPEEITDVLQRIVKTVDRIEQAQKGKKKSS